MGKTKLQKIFQAITIASTFVVVGLLILMIMGVFPKSRTLVDLLLVVGIICFGSISCMSVARWMEDKSKRIAIWCVLVLTGVTCLLWIVFVFIGQGFIDGVIAGKTTEAGLRGILIFTKITIFLTIQTALVNLVISNLFYFGKRMIAFQVIMYISNAIMDLWLSVLFLGLGINANGEFYFTSAFLLGRAWITLFILAVAYTIVSGAIVKGVQKRRMREIAFQNNEQVKYKEQNQETKETKVDETSVEARLHKLDKLRADNLISEEDYKAKKAKILEDL